MKLFLVTLSLLVASIGQADVKEKGDFVPRFCSPVVFQNNNAPFPFLDVCYGQRVGYEGTHFLFSRLYKNSELFEIVEVQPSQDKPIPGGILESTYLLKEVGTGVEMSIKVATQALGPQYSSIRWIRGHLFSDINREIYVYEAKKFERVFVTQ